MGHKYLLGMPRTPPFRRVIGLIGDGLGGGVAGVAPGGIDAIADATLTASDAGLQRAKVDDGLAFCVYLMAHATQAARQPEFLSALVSAGIPVPQRAEDAGGPQEYSVFDLVSGFTTAVDNHLRVTRSRNDISELAALAASESLSVLCRVKADTLYGTSEASVQQALKALSTPKGFGTLTHDFYARFIRRYLEYHLSRELSNHVGGRRRFPSVREHNEFLKQLDTHCRMVTGGVRAFAWKWYSKHNFDRDLSLRRAKGFNAHALDKVRDALRYQETRDGD